MGTIRVFHGSICPTTDSSYGDAGFRQSSMSSIGLTYYFFLLLFFVFLKCKILQKNVKIRYSWKNLNRFADVLIPS